MPYWVVVIRPGRKMPKVRGPYSVEGRAAEKVEEAEEQGFHAKKYYSVRYEQHAALAEIKEQVTDDFGYEHGAGNYNRTGGITS